jgi:glutathione S-transferase
MAKVKLTYFDAPVSRGEECRLALHVGGVDFEDVRVKFNEWPALKASTPYGAMPVIEVPGHAPVAQSNAILVLIGRRHELHPTDDFEAAVHESMMHYVEELRATVAPTMRMPEAEKKAAREALAADYIPAWCANVEKNLGDGPFFAGAKLHVVDIKLYVAVKGYRSGTIDYISGDIFDRFPKLMRLHDAVHDHPGVRSWYASR